MPSHCRIAAAITLFVLVGCSEVVAPAPLCANLVNVEGVVYTAAGGPLSSAAVLSSEAFAEVTARRECVDVNPKEGDNAALEPGESNFLPEGTTVHRVHGFNAEERLAYRLGTEEDKWQILVPVPGY